MSNQSPTKNDSAAEEPSPSDRTDQRTLERVLPSLAAPIRFASFWLAIFLPFLYIPLLLNGLSTGFEVVSALGLIAANVVVLYVGHAHRQ
ncbi:hypothetical protein OB905_01625 [Halobacteria archaeon AArc-dxtr1]|nr:hypothetical protein [Halobacteria archaeon AArc-dxtr1]